MRYFFELFLTVADKVVLLVGNFVVLKLLATLMTKDAFGYYSLVISIYVIISMLPFTAFDQAIFRYVSIYKQEDRWRESFVGIVYCFFIVTAPYIIFGAVMIIFIESSDLRTLIFVTVCFSTTEIYRVSLLNIEHAKRNRLVNVISNGSIYLFRSISIWILFRFSNLSLINVLLVFSGLSSLNIVYIYFLNRADFVSIFKVGIHQIRNVLSDLYLYARPMIVWGPFIWSQNMVNRWYLKFFAGQESVANYVTINAIATLIPTAFFGILWTLILPIMYQKENLLSGYSQWLNRFIIPLFGGILLIGLLGCIFFQASIVKIVFGEKYMDSSWMLPYLYLAAAIIQLAAYGSSELYAQHKTHKLLLPNIIPGIFAAIPGFALVWLWQENGAVSNALITALIYFMLVSTVIIKNRRTLQ